MKVRICKTSDSYELDSYEWVVVDIEGNIRATSENKWKDRETAIADAKVFCYQINSDEIEIEEEK